MTKLNKRWAKVSNKLQDELNILKSVADHSLTDYTKRGQDETDVAVHIQGKLHAYKNVVIECMKELEAWRKEGDEQVKEIVDKF